MEDAPRERSAETGVEMRERVEHNQHHSAHNHKHNAPTHQRKIQEATGAFTSVVPVMKRTNKEVSERLRG